MSVVFVAEVGRLGFDACTNCRPTSRSRVNRYRRPAGVEIATGGSSGTWGRPRPRNRGRGRRMSSVPAHVACPLRNRIALVAGEPSRLRCSRWSPRWRRRRRCSSRRSRAGRTRPDSEVSPVKRRAGRAKARGRRVSPPGFAWIPDAAERARRRSGRLDDVDEPQLYDHFVLCPLLRLPPIIPARLSRFGECRRFMRVRARSSAPQARAHRRTATCVARPRLVFALPFALIVIEADVLWILQGVRKIAGERCRRHRRTARLQQCAR